ASGMSEYVAIVTRFSAVRSARSASKPSAVITPSNSSPNAGSSPPSSGLPHFQQTSNPSSALAPPFRQRPLGGTPHERAGRSSRQRPLQLDLQRAGGLGRPLVQRRVQVGEDRDLGQDHLPGRQVHQGGAVGLAADAQLLPLDGASDDPRQGDHRLLAA